MTKITLIKSSFAIKMANKGHTGNGCGSTYISRYLAKTIQWWAGTDFSMCCFWHDLEYLNPQKSYMHKADVDFNFELNCLKMIDPTNSRQLKAARLFHAAVMLGGDKAYRSQYDKD